MYKQSENFTLKSRLGSFRFAFRGLQSLLKNEHNSRIHLLAAIVAFIVGILVHLNQYEWSLLIIVTGLVFFAELFNSSIESLADRVDPDWNELVGKAKDYSAAGVLISAFIALAVAGMIFIPKLLNRL
jgi:diacylglycerol kinase (ATP)